ncbi:flagellar biosynthesis protein FlgA, partial [Acetobacter malorum]
SDLFVGLEPGQDKVLGVAPSPGQTIQVGGRQLIAIADQYGVDWIDQSSTAIARITRAGRVLDKVFFADLVRRNLPGNDNDAVVVELDDFMPMTVAADDAAPVVLSDVNWDQKSGRFTATVYRAHPLGDGQHDTFLLRGSVRATQSVLVFAHALPGGSKLSASDVRVNDSYTGHVTNQMFSAATSIEGMTLLHSVVADQVILDRDLQKTIVMHKGDPVLISFRSPGLHLAVTGRALEDGFDGQYVRALNLASKMIVTGRVVNGSELDVDTTSGPVPSDSATLRRLTSSSNNGLGVQRRSAGW